MTTARPASKFRIAIWFVFRWLCRCACAAGLFYSTFLGLGCVPVNSGFVPATGDDCVVIFVRSNEIHTDLVLPASHTSSDCDWRTVFPAEDFRGPVADCPYVAIGWGNRSFYIDTPTWADFKLRTAARALFWPSESVLHIEYVPAIDPAKYFQEVRITAAQYQQLVKFVERSIRKDVNCRATTASAKTYHTHDRFYESTGRYHALNTCNQWTGRGLKSAGVKTGLWTPLKPQVLYWLPARTMSPDARR